MHSSVNELRENALSAVIETVLRGKTETLLRKNSRHDNEKVQTSRFWCGYLSRRVFSHLCHPSQYCSPPPPVSEYMCGGIESLITSPRICMRESCVCVCVESLLLQVFHLSTIPLMNRCEVQAV